MFNSFISNAVVMQIAATIILVLFIKKWTYSAYVEYMQKRKDTVNGNIEDARNKQEQAAFILSELEAEKKELKLKKMEILASSEEEAKKEKNIIIAEAKERAHALLEKAQIEIEQEKLQVQEELSNEVIQMATLVAEKFLVDAIDAEDNNAMMNQALKKVNLERA